MNVVIIKEDGTFYFTIAVAIHYDGRDGNNVEYFILNEDDEFEMVHEFFEKKDGRLVKKRVLFNDVYKCNEDIIRVGNYYGYKRFVNDRKLLNRIRNGEKDIFSREDMIFYQSIKYSRNGINTIVDDKYSCEVLYNLCDYFSKHKNEASAKRLACCRFGNQTKWIGDDYDGSCYCTEENLEFNYDPITKRATCDGQLYYNVDADIDEAIAMQQKSCREIGSAAKWTGYTCVCKDSDMVYSYDKETKTGKCIENTKKEKLAKDIIDDENEILATNIWADYRYLNVKSNYGSNNIDERSRIHMGAVGFDSKNFDTGAGDLAFGGFIGYANQNMMDFTSDGYFVGFFTKYNYGMFGLTGMVTNGALMNSSDIHRFDNSWTNAAMDMSLKIKTYRSLYFQPMIYGGYTHVSTDRLRINNVPTVPEDSFTFWNVAPSVKIGALLSDHLYGAISGKYVMTYGDKNKDLYVNNVLTDRTTAKDYGEFGLNLEYNLDGVILSGAAYKLTNGFDGWSGNINVKYVF